MDVREMMRAWAPQRQESLLLIEKMVCATYHYYRYFDEKLRTGAKQVEHEDDAETRMFVRHTAYTNKIMCDGVSAGSDHVCYDFAFFKEYMKLFWWGVRGIENERACSNVAWVDTIRRLLERKSMGIMLGQL